MNERVKRQFIRASENSLLLDLLDVSVVIAEYSMDWNAFRLAAKFWSSLDMNLSIVAMSGAGK